MYHFIYQQLTTANPISIDFSILTLHTVCMGLYEIFLKHAACMCAYPSNFSYIETLTLLKLSNTN